MPFNIPVFKTRSVTAVFFVLIMLAGLLINAFTFALLFAVVMTGCLVEYIRIIRLIFPVKFPYYISGALLYVIMPVMMIADLAGLIPASGDFRDVSFDPLLPCAIIFSIWINDTMAYVIGSWIGKTPFSSISPKKTWEGTLGGVILCILVISLLAGLPVARSVSRLHWSAIAAISAVFGTLGDLFESKLKRLAGIKDSGKIMPGHGGFLDRFDSFLVAVPFVWLYVRVFLH